MPFSVNAVNSSILNHFHANYSTVASIVLTPEAQFDQQTAQEWVEFGVKSFAMPKQRKTGRTILKVMATANCWIKKSASSIYRGRIVTDSILDLLEHTGIAVQDFDTGGSPTVGNVRFREGRVINMTGQLPPGEGEMFQVQIEGLAEET